MAERLTTQDLLAIAMGEMPAPQLGERDRQALEMIRSTVATIRGDAADPVPAAVIERAKKLSSELPKAPSWFDRAAAVVLSPLFDDRPQLALGLRGDDLRQCTYAAGDLRLDLEIGLVDSEPTSGGEAQEQTTRVRGQIDGETPLEAAVPVVVFVAGTNRLVTSTLTAPDGRFDLFLPPGAYEFAFRLGADLQSIGSIEIP